MAGIAGTFVPSSLLSPDAGRLLVLFTGLIAASVLPTISLMVGSMSSTGRSTHVLRDLHKEISASIDSLLFVFGCACVVVMALIGMTLDWTQFTTLYWLADTGAKAFQAILFASLVLLLNRSRSIPNSIRRTLDLKSEIAVSEASRRVNENAPSSGETAKLFRTREGFGRNHSLTDLKTGND